MNNEFLSVRLTSLGLLVVAVVFVVETKTLKRHCPVRSQMSFKSGVKGRDSDQGVVVANIFEPEQCSGKYYGLTFCHKLDLRGKSQTQRARKAIQVNLCNIEYFLVRS